MSCPDRLISRLDEAASLSSDDAICEAVKAALRDEIINGDWRLPDEFVTPIPDCYGRRLLHRDPQGRYTIVVMVWGSGQSTPIHDHSGMWCVECVYQGKIEIKSYDPVGDTDQEAIRLDLEAVIPASFGEAGALIPPREYHVIANPNGETAVTVHIYGGEMDGCYIFAPREGEEGVYERQWRELSYAN